MGQKKKSKVLNTFEKGMFLDSLHSLQPKGTYREAWAVTNKTDKENKFGVANELANEIWVDLPKGTIRALLYVEERDYYLGFFIMDSGLSEIGILDEKTKEYTKVVDDNDLIEPLVFSDDEWNSLTAKVLQPCNQLHVYWSNADYFFRLNIDDKCKEWKTTPIKLFREHCIGIIQSTILNGGGSGLPNGIYQPFLRLKDADGNTTNWFKIGQPIQIGEGLEYGDNMAGENSGKAIMIKTEDLHKDYGIVDIGFHSTIGGVSSTVWVDTVAYGKGVLDYYYRGTTGKEIPLLASDVLGRNDLYIRGKSLMQFDGHLVLYNLRANNNIDWQRDVNNFKAFYQIYAVPLKEAYKYKSLRPNENYWFGIHCNYTDATKTADFAFIGKDGANAPMVTLPGCDCQVPNWEVEDTSKRTHTFCDLSELINKGSREYTLTDVGDNPVVPIYEPSGTKGAKPVVTDSKKYADPDETIKDLNEDFNDALDGPPGRSIASLKCTCDSFDQVLEDAINLAGGDLERSVRFAGINKVEIFDLACECEALKTEEGVPVYPPGYFTNRIPLVVL